MKSLNILTLASLAAGELIWPSKWDELEDLMTMLSGFGKRGFADNTAPCSFGTNVPGRQNTAEWVRTAFHDMATHDAAAGTGGLDASVFFETDRPENTGGSAFNNTFGFFSGFHNARASASDLIALGVVTATDMCRGPKVALRAGRIDADEAGDFGVPEPTTSMDDTTAQFKKAGFGTEDMIAMVACGHALGGVHSMDFPEIVEIPGSADNDTSVPFQEDPSAFNHGVITEYLDGTTKNPLVVAANDTFNSDKRIFEVDGNKTMTKMATKAGFDAMCADIFTRMIDTVPSTVTLSDVIEPYDVRPYISELSLNGDGELVFSGRIRLRTTKGLRDASDMAVSLTYADRSGKGETAIKAKAANFQGGSSVGLHGENFMNYEFDARIPAASGISAFWIHETTVSTNTTTVHKNGKAGSYPVSDTVLYQLSESCLGNYDAGKFPIKATALVRKEQAPEAGGLTFDVVNKVARQGTMVPKLVVEKAEFKPTGEERSGWVEYRAETEVTGPSSFDISLNGKVAVEFQHTGPMPNECKF